ncbi:MAG: hypothetical protein JXA09_00775 [Anaerolineae bacterium]|nr:hypothetical protein [Anaerolineae bacterium]
MSDQIRPTCVRIPSASLDGPTVREDLPYPIVHYPQRGVFLAFAPDEGTPPALCACARAGLEHAVELARSRGDPAADGSALDLSLVPESVAALVRLRPESPLDAVRFVPRLCHRCNMAVPALRYCHELEGGRFIQTYGWYVAQAYLRYGIALDVCAYLPEVCPTQLRTSVEAVATAAKALDNLDSQEPGDAGGATRMRDAERQYVTRQYRRACASLDRTIESIVRQEFGFQPVGEGWVSETMLYQVVRRVCAGHEVLRRDRPAWLDGLELDVHVPELGLAFEYQGQQHYHAVAAWDGIEALAALQDRDRRKARLCAERGVMLIAIDYTEPLTEAYVRERISRAAG